MWHSAVLNVIFCFIYQLFHIFFQTAMTHSPNMNHCDCSSVESNFLWCMHAGNPNENHLHKMLICGSHVGLIYLSLLPFIKKSKGLQTGDRLVGNLVGLWSFLDWIKRCGPFIKHIISHYPCTCVAHIHPLSSPDYSLSLVIKPALVVLWIKERSHFSLQKPWLIQKVMKLGLSNPWPWWVNEFWLILTVKHVFCYVLFPILASWLCIIVGTSCFPISFPGFLFFSLTDVRTFSPFVSQFSHHL